MSGEARVRLDVDEAAARHAPPAAVREPGLKGTLKTFLELVKFEHSIFALPYAYIAAIYGAAFVASAWTTEGGWPTLGALLWVTVHYFSRKRKASVEAAKYKMLDDDE